MSSVTEMTDRAGEPPEDAGAAGDTGTAGDAGAAGDAGMPGDPGLAAERDRLARTLRETRLQLTMTQARLGALEQSSTMELGRTLVRAARRPWPRGAKLPLDLVRLWRERGGLAGPGAATLALASAQLGDLAGGGERFLSALTAPGLGTGGLATGGLGAPGLGAAGLVITGVLTARSCATLAPDGAVLPLLPHDADVMLESAGADLVLIEAAAMLAGSAWAYAGDAAAADRGRRLGRLIAAARALGKPAIFIRNVPALAPGLDWVAASCDAVSDDGLCVQLARYNPIGLDGNRPRDPNYAEPRDPREPPAVRSLLDAIAGSVPASAYIPWHRRPALYREHAAFVTVSADQAREQLACGAHVVMVGGEQAQGAIMPNGDGWSAEALQDTLAAVAADRPADQSGIVPVLREIFAAHATPVRLTALAALAGLPAGIAAGRQIAVAARAGDAAAAAGLGASLLRQHLPPAEVVVLVGAPDDGSAELPGRAVAAALAELADRGVRIRTVPWPAGQPADQPAGEPAGLAGGLARAASMARSPWVVPWQAGHEYEESYLLDLACARECSQADAVGYAGAAYAFTTSLEPALARREFFTSGGAASNGPRLFSVS